MHMRSDLGSLTPEKSLYLHRVEPPAVRRGREDWLQPMNTDWLTVSLCNTLTYSHKNPSPCCYLRSKGGEGKNKITSIIGNFFRYKQRKMALLSTFEGQKFLYLVTGRTTQSILA